MDWSEQTYCEQDQLATFDVDPDYANVISLRRDRAGTSSRHSHHSHQASKTQAKRRSPAQKDQV